MGSLAKVNQLAVMWSPRPQAQAFIQLAGLPARTKHTDAGRFLSKSRESYAALMLINPGLAVCYL